MRVLNPGNAESNGVTDGGKRGESPPRGKINAKTGPPIADILIFSILLVFSRLLFFLRFLGIFGFFYSS